MNHRGNLIFSFFISLAMHGIIILSVSSFIMMGNSQLVPVFRQGSSSVTVTLMGSERPEPAPIIKHEIRKEVSRPVVVKREEKTITPKPVIPVKSPVVKQEIPKPVIAVKPENSELITEEYSSVPETAIEESLNNYNSDSSQEPVENKNVSQPMDGDELDKGISTFADTESFVDIHPTYPLGARLRGEEGVVVVRVTVSPEGHAVNVEVMKSSGYAALDESAIDALKRARFVARNGGTIRGGEVTLPFRFKLVN
ncbi:MAG: TonB family protein [Kiritimatiellae bacterium]|nr:TonB family protein [Kiritimatiellia bacterium]MDD5522212.1 TonB family protein [Kiritimatiellia bacterium]